MLSRGELARLAIDEAAFRQRVAKTPCNSATDARALIGFAHQCVVQTPLEGGATPWQLLDDYAAIQDGVRLVEQWLAGEAVELTQLDEAYSAARRVANTLASNMVGATAAQWAGIAVIDAARMLAGADRPQKYPAIVESVAFTALYARAAGIRPDRETLHFQQGLADQLLPK